MTANPSLTDPRAAAIGAGRQRAGAKARRTPLPQEEQPAPAPVAPALEPCLWLAGDPVTVRAYGAVEWLRLLPATRPVVEALAALLAAGQEPTYEAALAAIAGNIDALLPVIVRATDLAPADLEALDPEDMELLLMSWWGCNGRFFIGRAINQVAITRAARRLVRPPVAEPVAFGGELAQSLP